MLKNWNWTHAEDQNSSQNSPRNSAVASTNATRNNFLRSAAAPFYLAPLGQLYQDMDRMFVNTLRSFGLPAVFGSPMRAMQNMFTPSVDISSTDKEYRIEMEVPGLSEDDVRLDITRDGQLCICGEKRMENDKQEKDFHRVERSYGSFSRILSLPQDVDQENIEANFENGILTITAPRLESASAQGRRIEVNGADTNRGRTKQHLRDAKQDNSPAGAHPKRTA